MSSRRLTTVVAVAMLAVLAGCDTPSSPSSPATSRPDRVKVGLIPIVDVAPIYLGKERGFFAERGINLHLELAQGGATIVPAVVSGQYHFGFSNVVSLMLAHSYGVPIDAVANGVNSTGDPAADFSALVVKDPEIETAKDLEGKTVASNTLKNIVDTSVLEIVRQEGGDPEKVTFAEMGFNDMAAALDADRVQAIFVVEPFLAAALAKGWRIIGSFADIDPNLCVALYFSSTRLANENPDLVNRFVQAMKESLAYADSHPDEVRQIVTSYTQIAPELVASMTLPRWSSEIDVTSIDTMNSLLVNAGVLTRPADTAGLISRK